MKVVFDVEQAGCESCGKVIGAALEEVGTLESIAIDEDADLATVVLAGAASRSEVDAALEQASSIGGHTYRLRPESWRTVR